jgi:hypothetical protein
MSILINFRINGRVITTSAGFDNVVERNTVSERNKLPRRFMVGQMLSDLTGFLSDSYRSESDPDFVGI